MNKIKAIEEYGRLYVAKFLRDRVDNRDHFYNDWREGLNFLFSKVFYRGRRDELSERFMNAALKTLKELGLNKDYDKQLLDNKLRLSGVNNGRDRRMISEVLDFIFNLPTFCENNFVKYTVNQIKEGKISDIFNKLNGIYAIGDKLASFYLRDVILIFELEKYLKVDDFQYCQPVDTWVKQVAIKLDIITSQDTETKLVKSAIINACEKAGASPLLFNAGAWMVGARSFELLIEKL